VCVCLLLQGTMVAIVSVLLETVSVSRHHGNLHRIRSFPPEKTLELSVPQVYTHRPPIRTFGDRERVCVRIYLFIGCVFRLLSIKRECSRRPLKPLLNDPNRPESLMKGVNQKENAKNAKKNALI